MTASPTDDLASAERRIQELTKELFQARGELSQARGELAGAREQQAATADILRVISSSPTDLQRVFAEIAESAAYLCDAYDATIHQLDGDLLRLVAHHGPIPVAGSRPLTRGRLLPGAVINRRTIHVADLQAETDEYPEGSDIARRLGYHTILVAPLIRAGVAIGVITIRRTEVRPFTDRQIELLKIFADQAVIAIENTRLFEEVQTRTKELQDSLDRQTATSEVLGVISRSPNEVQPVLDTIVATAQRLCRAERASIWRLEGGTFRAVAHHGTPEELVESLYSARRPLSRGSMIGRATLARRAVQVEDVVTDPELVAGHAFSRAGNIHTVLAVPLLLKGNPIGVIALARTRVAPFDDKQVALVEAFADQAVIAIENSPLFEAEQESKRELQESLEYQTAISEVLGVISRSQFDLQPVLQSVVDTAARLCEADKAAVRRRQGDAFPIAAGFGFSAEQFDYFQHDVRRSLAGPVVSTRRTLHFPDLRANPDPAWLEAAEIIDSRTGLGVPLMREGELIGTLFLVRSEHRPFSDKQIKLVETFADQAVIAIENTRLFEEVQARTKELQDSLDRQTATSEVLGVISRSPNEVQPVLDTIVATAQRLCQAERASVWRLEGETFRAVAHHGLP